MRQTASRRDQPMTIEAHIVGTMHALLVHPRTPPTYWGFQHSLPIAGKAASLPPLGLLSLAPLLPDGWELRVVDENTEPLAWALNLGVGSVSLAEAIRAGRPIVGPESPGCVRRAR